jgi:hypothetical protein
MRYFLFIGILFCGCYSFKGISIDPEVKTFMLENLQTQAQNTNPNEANMLGERIKTKFLQGTRLTYSTDKPHLVFSGAITGYNNTSVAPQAGTSVAFVRLTVNVHIECENTLDDKKNWSSDFSRFVDYSSETDLSTIENSLLKEINELLVEDIFNKAFTNW